MDLARARDVLTALEQAIEQGSVGLRPFAPAVRLEIAIAEAENEADRAVSEERSDPLFRLRMGRWAMRESDLAGLFPVRERGFRILKFDHDVSPYRDASGLADFPAAPLPGPSYILAFASCESREQDPLLVDARTVRVLELSDGTRTAHEIATQLHRQHRTAKRADCLERIERLFVSGLLGLCDTPADPEAALARTSTDASAGGATRRPAMRTAPFRRKSPGGRSRRLAKCDPR